jgi:filamentous hemagglutinin
VTPGAIENHADYDVPVILGGNPATGDKNDGSFPDSHRWYTQSLFPDDMSLRGVNVRESTDRNWGAGNFSEPVFVAPSQTAKAELEKRGGK